MGFEPPPRAVDQVGVQLPQGCSDPAMGALLPTHAQVGAHAQRTGKPVCLQVCCHDRKGAGGPIAPFPQLTQVTPAILRGLSLPQAKPPQLWAWGLPSHQPGRRPMGSPPEQGQGWGCGPSGPPCPPGGSSVQEAVFLLGSN